VSQKRKYKISSDELNVIGESHCRDIFAVASHLDSAALVEGRKEIERILAEWLEIDI
jgi:hypothetical protein